MSIFNKIWRLFKVAKILVSLNSSKFTRVTSLLSSPGPHRHLEFVRSRSLSNCINDFEDDEEYIVPKKIQHLHENEKVHKTTPFVSASTTPSTRDSSASGHFSSKEDINKRAEDFISKMKRQISLDVAYTRSPSPSPFGPPISPESYFNRMKEKGSFSSVQFPAASPVVVKPSSLNIRYPTDSPRMKKRPSLVVHRPMAIT